MKQEDGIVVGAFRLIEPIGEGGMGEVWRARHCSEAVEVAIKVITSRLSDDDEYHAEFRREVEAVAGLHHAGIVALYDFGHLGAEVEAASAGRLRAGSPWFAMELAQWGNLNHTLVDHWRDTRLVIFDVLDALAHAHARGVIHRDLKPQNILLSEVDDEVILKLTDFGIAHIMRGDRSPVPPEIAGTPHYMAPEQFGAQWRDFGPWTDLYALGIMVWELVCGRLPFVGNFFQLAYAHGMKSLPPFEPRFEVPQGLEEWIRRLLQKSPYDRFECAADAAWELYRLEKKSGSITPQQSAGEVTIRIAPKDVPTRVEAPPTQILTRSSGFGRLTALHTLETPEEDEAEPAAGEASPPGRAPVDLPPVPRVWARKDEHRPRIVSDLSGVGLGLFGLRTVPFVDRNAERDAIWDALRGVHRDGRARAIVVRGEAGCGKTRLVEWMVERTRELGAATVLQAVCDPLGGDALETMLRTHLRCQGLDRPKTFRRIQKLAEHIGAPEHEAEALAELVVRPAGLEAGEGGEGGEAPVVRFATPRERFMTVANYLRRLTRRRPAVLWLEDVQWGADLVSLAQHLLEHEPDLPVLLLLTVREEVLPVRPAEQRLIERLEHHLATRVRRLEPLAPADRVAQVNRLLRLAPELAQRVAQRTEGNPLFAVQLVGDWVQRGVLESHPEGFRLRPSLEDAPLPDDIHALWLQRLGELGQSFGRRAVDTLGVAAALGHRVDPQEWHRACELIGLTVPPGFDEALVSRRMARRVDAGWSFAHGLLRESLVRRFRESGQWPRMNSACAAILSLLHPRPSALVQERRASYLVEAEQHELALGIYLEAADERLEREEFGDLARVLQAIRASLEAAGVAASDRRRGEVLRLEAKLARGRGELTRGRALAEDLLALATQHGWRALRADALCMLATSDAMDRGLEHAAASFDEAVKTYRELGEQRRLAQVLRYLSHLHGLRGQVDRARRCGREGYDLYRRLDDREGMAWCVYYVGLTFRLENAHDEVRRHLGRALEIAQQAGLRDLQANCHNVLADIDRMEGLLPQAETGYRRALFVWDTIGSKSSHSARLNLGLVLLERRAYCEARELFEELVQVFEGLGQKIFLGASHTALIGCCLGTDAPERAREHLSAAVRLLEETGLQDPDIAILTESAGDLFAEVADRASARACHELARDQWRALRNVEAVRRLEAKLS